MRIKTNVSPKGFFPAGYKLVTTGMFPGFDVTKRIPISVSVYNTGRATNNFNVSTSSYINFAAHPRIICAGASASSVRQGDMSISMNIGSIDILRLCNYDFEKMKTIISIDGGTINAWLEKVGV